MYVLPLLLVLAASADYVQTFDRDEALRDFVFTDPDAWVHGDGSLDLIKKISDYEPTHRSPHNIALLDGRQYGSFTLEVELMSTDEEYAHRSMCLFFNVQDPQQYYYVHISSQATAHAHNVFIVKDAPRAQIGTKTTAGHRWGEDEWHRIRIVRDVESGLIEVYINGEKTMEARDKTFTRGHIGFGSFDDTGRVRNIRITGKPVSTEKAGFFKTRQ